MDKKASAVRVSNPGNKNEEPRSFTFDIVFGPDTKQADLYDSCCRVIVDSVMQGYNGTIFAYGQTGTGKTFTMEGDLSDQNFKGVIPRTFDHVFSQIEVSGGETKYMVFASFIQIYNDQILDLLSKDRKNQTKLELKESPDSGVFVKDMEQPEVKSVDDLNKLLHEGKQYRKTAGTNMNDESSRSHCIFTIRVEQSSKGPDGQDHVRVGKLNMVDLAGSERIAKTGAQGSTQKEGIHINKSLSALGNVIAALTRPNPSGKKIHIPYRDSKLTRLLEDSLGGNTRTIMIANIGPADYNHEETISTLRFADRAKNIKNKPKINEDPKDAKMREYQEEIARLKQQLAMVEMGGGGAMDLAALGALGATAGPGGVPQKIVVPKIMTKVKTVGVSEEEKARVEQELEKRQQEIKEKHEREKADVLNLTKQLQEKKDTMATELKTKEQQLEEERKVRAELKKKLQDMEKKIVIGDKIIDEAKKQKILAEKKRAEAVRLELEQQRLERERKEKEETHLDLKSKFDTLEKEVASKSKKLEKLLFKYQELKRDLDDASAEIQKEREELLEMIRDLTKQIQLKDTVLAHFVPKEEVDKVRERAYFDADRGEWLLKPMDLDKMNTELLRPRSAFPHLARATTEFARVRVALGDDNPRFKSDNIIDLALDMPTRTTQDYHEHRQQMEAQAQAQQAATMGGMYGHMGGMGGGFGSGADTYYDVRSSGGRSKY